MRIPSPSAKRKARIEIIPLIDVVFFLLATFVMTSLSMVKNQGLTVKLPSAATAIAEDRKSSVTVTITQNREVFLDKERLEIASLKGRLTAALAEDPDLKVFINGDEEANFGLAVQVLDDIRSLGITKVAIQTKPKK
jgi:biopolymer transport protein ExbD